MATKIAEPDSAHGVAGPGGVRRSLIVAQGQSVCARV